MSSTIPMRVTFFIEAELTLFQVYTTGVLAAGGPLLDLVVLSVATLKVALADLSFGALASSVNFALSMTITFGARDNVKRCTFAVELFSGCHGFRPA